MDAELDGLLKDMSPEERQEILNAKDPKEVARVMKKKMAGAGAPAEEE